jgi:hypothetical protein
MRLPGRALSCIPHRKQRGCQMTSDLIAQVRINLESVELAARLRFPTKPPSQTEMMAPGIPG